MTAGRIVRLALLSIAVVAAVLVLLLGGTALFLQTETGRTQLARLVERLASTPGGAQLKVGRIEPGLPLHLAIDEVSLADAEGPWLVAHALRLSWRPWDLLAARLRVDELSAGSVHVIRKPAAGAPESEPSPGGGFEIPRLPLSVRIERIGIGSLQLDQPVLGTPATFALDGRLAAIQDGKIRSELRVERQDGGEGQVRLVADYDQAARMLSVDGVIREPADGLLLTLAGAPERPPLSVTLAGSGPIKDWHGTLDGNAPGWGDLHADLGLQAEGKPRFTANGSMQVSANPVPAMQPALAAGVGFDLALLLPDTDTLVVDEFALNGSGLSVSGSGRLDLAGSEADASVQFQLHESALTPGALGTARFDSAGARLSVSGALAAPKIGASGDLRALQLPGLRAGQFIWEAHAAPAPGEPAAPAGSLEITTSGRLQDLAFDNAVAQAAVGDNATLSLNATLVNDTRMLTVRSLALEGAQTRLDARGDVPLGKGELDARADLVLADLAPVARAAGAAASAGGRVAAGIHVRGALQPLAVEGDAEVVASSLATGVPAADVLAGSAPRLDARFSYGGENGLAIPHLAFAGGALQGEGSARLPAGFDTVDARLRLSAPSLAPLSAPLGTELRGVLGIDVSARGNTADPDVAVAVQVRDALAAGVEIPEARVDLSATTATSRPAGRLAARATTSMGPVAASTDFVMQPDGVLRVAPIGATAAGLRLSGMLDLATGSGLADGRLLLDSDPARPVVQAGTRSVSGPLRLDISLTSAGDRQGIDANLRAGPLVVRENGAEQARIAALAGDVVVQDALATPDIRGELRAQSVKFGQVDLDRLRAGVDGTPRQARFALSAAAAGQAHDDVDVAGVVTTAGDVRTVVLERLDGRLGGERLALQRPARLLSAPDSLQLSGLDLAVGSGRLSADGVLRPRETTATVRGTALPAGLAHAYAAAAPSSGSLDLDLALRTTGALTTGDAEIRLHALGWAQAKDQANAKGQARKARPKGRGKGKNVAADSAAAARMDGSLRARLDGGRANLTLAIDGPNEATARATASMPVRVPAGETSAVIDRNSPIEGHVALAADLAKASLLLGLDDQRMGGDLRGDLTLGGSLAAPRVGGNLTLADGLYENFVSGTLLRNLSMRIDAVDTRTLALQLTGNDGNSGRISLDGTGGFDDAGNLRVDGSLKADAATLIRRDDVTATTDADLAIALAGTEAKLSGRIETRTIVVNLLERLPPSVVVLPVREIGLEQPAGDAAEASAPGVTASLDLSISMPRRVFVRGRGLESEWSGALMVTGTADAPQIVGSVNLVRGTFSFAGKRFDLQRGDVSFTGGAVIDPLINAVAEYRASSITAQIRITGFASDPKLEITSQPPLPESEVLAQVLFGKSTARLGPVEAVQLAAALDTLARGDSMSEDVFSFARTLLGLDTLTVQPSSNGDGGSSVAVGRYVGDRVYIGAEQGIERGGQTGTVEVEVAPGISVTSEIGQSATTGTQGALGLKFKWDY